MTPALGSEVDPNARDVTSRLARRGGVYRIKNEIYDEIRIVLKERLAEVCMHIFLLHLIWGRVQFVLVWLEASHPLRCSPLSVNMANKNKTLKQVCLVMESGTIPSSERKVRRSSTSLASIEN
jgi:hypothetical protein